MAPDYRLFKVLVIGDVGVGKSSIILRYVKRDFSENYKPSIGVDFALKTVEWDPNTVVRLQFWDIAGQERFKKMSRVFYKAAMGALVVFDITDSSSFEGASEWKRDLDSKVCLNSGCPIPAVLLANKCDLAGQARDLDKFCKDNSFLGWFETSAKDNINVEEAGAFLVKHMMRCDTDLSDEERHGDGIKVDQALGDGRRRPLCC
uniref:Ras-related protein Rab n=1 Tax=Sphaeramia orbicularis TaxID=375764 RepID=A0A673BRJ9_9TELE